MSRCKTKLLIMLTILSLSYNLYAQATGVENLIDDTKKDTDTTRDILDYKPKSLSAYISTKMEYDSNVYKTDNDALWDQGNRKKGDTIWKNTIFTDYNFNTEEDHALGVKYVGEFDYYHNNKNKELGMHDLGLFYQYDMDPDPISLRTDLDYKFIRIGEEAFMTTKECVGLIKVKYNELFETSTSIFNKGEYRVDFAYNQYKDNYNNIQNESGLDSVFKYKHIISFSKARFPIIAKYIKDISCGLEYKNASPRNNDSKYAEFKIRPKVKFQTLPFKMTASIEWVHYDRQYDYRVSDNGGEHRRDRRDDAKFGLAKRLNKYLTLNINYTRGWRDSNVSTAEYRQNVYAISVSAFF